MVGIFWIHDARSTVQVATQIVVTHLETATDRVDDECRRRRRVPASSSSNYNVLVAIVS